MKQYLDSVRHIFENGHFKGDRTGVGTQSVFGTQERYDLKAGFPLVTTKEVNFEFIKAELKWLLEGSTDNTYLNELGTKIWDAWALREEDLDKEHALSLREREIYAYSVLECDGDDLDINYYHMSEDQKHEVLDRSNVPHTRTYREMGRKVGELGPIYGQQWRSWESPDGSTIDQIKEVIELLKTKPDSRRIIVSAWNPADLPDESISPHDNVLNGKAALASCHTLFQFYSRELTGDELYAVMKDTPLLNNALIVAGNEKVNMRDLAIENGIPTRVLSCQLYQRSADVFLGKPYNIASYALLTHLIAHQVGMDVGEFVHTCGDAHIYSNHREQLKEQLTREPYPLPKLVIDPALTDIFNMDLSHIKLEGYQSHGKLVGKVAV